MHTLIDIIRRGTLRERLKLAWLFLLLTGGWAAGAGLYWLWLEGR
jgi:hypothetical protein